jgi:triacylglycerol esterase/lipase EstA (alpha/beta hydrolase family)
MCPRLASAIVLTLAAGCSDAAFLSDSGVSLGELDGTVRGNPYDGAATDEGTRDEGTKDDGGADGASDPSDLSNPSDASNDASEHGDAGPETTDTGPKPCPPDLFLSSRPAGDLKAAQKQNGEILYDCDAARYSIILAAGVKVKATLWGQYLRPGLHIFGPGNRGAVAESGSPLQGAVVTVEFTADLAGEYFAVVDQSDRHGTARFEVGFECLEKCDLRATRYPIVMVHGFSGFLNIGPIEYFYKVVDTLSPLGYDLHIAVLDAYNHTEVRGPQLAEFIDSVLGDTFASKVNVIGHSQGGVDTRYAISTLGYGDRVATLSMVASPHQGSEVCDLILDDPTGIGKGLAEAMFTVLGVVLDGPEAEQNAHASFVSLSTGYMRGEFNPQNPDDPRVAYRSWAGKTCYAWENCGTAVNSYLVPTFEILRSRVGDNDGIVPTESAKWTGFQSVIAADHFDEVGQIAGMTGSFDHLRFYRGIVESIEADGY